MKILILKLNATGDVVRTTPLLRFLEGEITWLTASRNTVLLSGLAENLRCLSWEERILAKDADYDLVINLEDDVDVAWFLKEVEYKQLFGAYMNGRNRVEYTGDSSRWFDLSLVSVHGKEKADQLKLENRHTYQEMIFDGLGLRFGGQKYILPKAVATDLSGDIAIAAEAGPVWPMKNWAYYDELKRQLEAKGLTVNVLPRRKSLLEHMGDVQSHRCLVGGDSLPMHIALGTQTRCVNLFNCTSPWEIYDYGIQAKIVSPLLTRYFYRRDFDSRATMAIGVNQVLGAVIKQLNGGV
jgi:ADP-heptose:LPS heptosyltransferase